ncbi:MAG: sugar ABC transporter substrate-binding protein, partial [Ruthenibacterium sp.]
LVKRFEEETGIDVVSEVIPGGELESKLVITNQSGEPAADLFFVSSQKMASMVNAGALMCLDDYYAALPTLSDFNQGALDSVTYAGDGKKYLMPVSIHGRGLWYNTDYVKEAPKTLDELVEVAKSVTKPEDGFYGLTFWGQKHYGTTELILGPLTWANGGKLANEDGSAAWNNEAAAKAIQFVSDAINVHKITPESVLTAEYDETAETFAAGNVAMIIDGTFRVTPFLKDSEIGKAGKVKFAPIPGVDGPAPCFSNGWAMAIPTNSKQPDLAWKFMEFFATPETQIEHAKFEGGLPVLNSCYDDPAFKEYPFPEFNENINQNGRPIDPFVYYQEGLESLSVVNMSYALDPTQDLTALLEESANDFNNKYYKK